LTTPAQLRSRVDNKHPVGSARQPGVGETDGAAVGNSVGETVGACVGSAVVGSCVGRCVGSWEGTAVGAPVGQSVVGVRVGSSVGVAVGSRVGTAVGAAEGLSVVGVRVGISVGVAVGANVGAAVGQRLHIPGQTATTDGSEQPTSGTRIWHSAASTNGGLVQPYVGRSVGDADGAALGLAVGGSVGEADGASVGDTVGRAVGAVVGLCEHSDAYPSRHACLATPVVAPVQHKSRQLCGQTDRTAARRRHAELVYTTLPATTGQSVATCTRL